MTLAALFAKFSARLAPPLQATRASRAFSNVRYSPRTGLKFGCAARSFSSGSGTEHQSTKQKEGERARKEGGEQVGGEMGE
eukprot:1348495-Amorphochlora_amoeboformis.AAC.1